MSSFVTGGVRSVWGKITRSALDTRNSRPPASMKSPSDLAMRAYCAHMTTAVVAGRAEIHGPPPVPDFEIVPKKGLPIVAVVLAGLVAAVASNKLWPVEFFHVAFGALSTAFDLFLGFVLGPILGTLSIPARIEMTTRLMPKMLLIMPTVVLCTLTAGWQLG